MVGILAVVAYQHVLVVVEALAGFARLLEVVLLHHHLRVTVVLVLRDILGIGLGGGAKQN